MSTVEEVESFTAENYLDSLLKMYEDNIAKEYRLINEVKYPLGRTNYVSVGLSPARGFFPVLKIASARKCVSLLENEWFEVLKHQERITKHVSAVERQVSRKRKIGAETEKTCVIRVFDNIQLKLQCNIKLNGQVVPVVKIQRHGSEVILDKLCIRKLFNECMVNLIAKRHDRLERLDFIYDYNLVLCSVVKNKKNDSAEKVEEYVRKLLCENIDESVGFGVQRNLETTDCVLEILIYELDKFKRDVASLSVLEM